MDIFLSKDEKIVKLEKRMGDLERKLAKNFSRVDESFETFRKIVLKMQDENVEIKRDRDFLLEKYKEVVRRLDGSMLAPVKENIESNFNLVKDLILEDIDIEPQKKNIDDLFELVMKKKKVAAKSASKQLGVDENRIRYWALKLQKQNLIDVKQNLNKVELLKK